MTSLGEMLVAFVQGLAAGRAGAPGEPVLEVTSLNVELPVELRIAHGGQLLATAPRGVMATGFMLPHGRVTARLEPSPTSDERSA